MSLLLITLHRLTPRWINLIFGKLQLVSASWMGFSHGSNDAQIPVQVTPNDGPANDLLAWNRLDPDVDENIGLAICGNSGR